MEKALPRRTGSRALATVREGSERDVVVHVVEAGGRLGGRLAGGRPRRRRAALLAAAIAAATALVAATAAFTAAEHLHLGGDDLGGVLFRAVLVGPLAGLQAA